VRQAVGMGHKLFGAVASLPFPTVALIDGNCMGGGTELALSMDDRIVSDAPHTKIALPEVKVGVIPGWGGTQRLPRLVGVQSAIEMITSGEAVGADKAAKIGLAFDAVSAESLLDEGVRRLEYLNSTGEWKKTREKRSQPLGLSPTQAMFAFGVAEAAIGGKTKGQYPAPLAALHAIRDGANLPLAEAFQVEAKAAEEVMGSPISANLIGIFFNQQRLSRDPGVSDPNVKPGEVRRVGVLGAGLMGAGIATAHARSGIPTAMVDVDDARLAEGLNRAEEVVTSRIKIGRATPKDLAQMLGLLSTSTSHNIFTDCDVVVEAVTENEKVKTEMFRQLGEVMKPGAILASNTSTISITRMAESAPEPERFLGMHFFSPVDRMELVEVVRGARTSDETVATVVALAKRIRKTPIVVNDCAGFLVNRVLFPYMNEALLLLQEGVPMDTIDLAATAFGMPMGPIALQDMVGLDTSLYAGHVLAQAYPDRAKPSGLLADLVQQGRLGRKSGKGFRRYNAKGKAQNDPDVEAVLEKHRVEGHPPRDLDGLQARLFLPMLLEATRALEDGIVREPADVDMGVILGIGFPPFKGGLLRWADTEGEEAILRKLEPLQKLGKRFEPTETLKQMAQTGQRFYPVPKMSAQAS
jgi:3-hydroxyacyl-CoA dehydrogenase/enoyl-CoA hydratase/3-hydroxybutyryl-CoA epimerase/3-hydroxyacyl-CoA dehydrogenase/enoyl-CoA hydratase/3-hydroxybutyryl-CoA epimerase/enoyl-CoA isomerase